MFSSVRELQCYSVQASDGPLGPICNVLFDDAKWVIRYLVVDAGTSLDGRRVLISPISVRSIEHRTRRLIVELTADRIRHSPHIDHERPVSKREEASFHAYYGYSPYWSGPELWGRTAFPEALASGGKVISERTRPRESERPRRNLRSDRDVTSCGVLTANSEIGRVNDLIVGNDSWNIRYLVVDTDEGADGRSVLLSPRMIRRADWPRFRLHVDFTVDVLWLSSPYRERPTEQEQG